MAKGQSKEAIYTQQLMDLGVYKPAFDGAIHMLCIQERELSRAMKAWKATAPDKNTPPSITSELYTQIRRLRQDILQWQDSLGLTPSGLKKLLGKEAAVSSGTVKLEDLL